MLIRALVEHHIQIQYFNLFVFTILICSANYFHIMCFRPYEIIAVATCKGIAIWHIGLSAESDGSLSTENVAVLSGHDGEVQ